jgi:hypothetical protein
MNTNTATPKESNAPQEKTGGGWMRRLVRLLRWMLFNGGISALAWYAVNGNTGAGRLLQFVVWTFAVIMFMASMNKDATPKIAAKGRTIPAWLSHGWGAVMICFLVWHGWIGAAIALLIWEIAEAAIFHQPNARAMASGAPESPLK